MCVFMCDHLNHCNPNCNRLCNHWLFCNCPKTFDKWTKTDTCKQSRSGQQKSIARKSRLSNDAAASAYLSMRKRPLIWLNKRLVVAIKSSASPSILWTWATRTPIWPTRKSIRRPLSANYVAPIWGRNCVYQFPAIKYKVTVETTNDFGIRIVGGTNGRTAIKGRRNASAALPVSECC